jgi:hypothetical protein
MDSESRISSLELVVDTIPQVCGHFLCFTVFKSNPKHKTAAIARQLSFTIFIGSIDTFTRSVPHLFIAFAEEDLHISKQQSLYEPLVYSIVLHMAVFMAMDMDSILFFAYVLVLVSNRTFLLSWTDDSLHSIRMEWKTSTRDLLFSIQWHCI